MAFPEASVTGLLVCGHKRVGESREEMFIARRVKMIISVFSAERWRQRGDSLAALPGVRLCLRDK